MPDDTVIVYTRKSALAATREQVVRVADVLSLTVSGVVETPKRLGWVELQIALIGAACDLYAFRDAFKGSVSIQGPYA